MAEELEKLKNINFLNLSQYNQITAPALDELWAIESPSIIKTNNLSGISNWYVVYSNGLCIQSGYHSFANASTWEYANLAIPYINTNYRAFAITAGTATTIHDVKVGNHTQNTQSSVAMLCSNSNGACNWFTMGVVDLANIS